MEKEDEVKSNKQNRLAETDDNNDLPTYEASVTTDNDQVNPSLYPQISNLIQQQRQYYPPPPPLKQPLYTKPFNPSEPESINNINYRICDERDYSEMSKKNTIYKEIIGTRQKFVSYIAKENEVIGNIGSFTLDLRGTRISRGESMITIKSNIGKVYLIIPYYMCISIEEESNIGKMTEIINFGITKEEAIRLDYPILNLKFVSCIGHKIIIEKPYSEPCNADSIKRDIEILNNENKKLLCFPQHIPQQQSPLLNNNIPNSEKNCGNLKSFNPNEPESINNVNYSICHDYEYSEMLKNNIIFKELLGVRQRSVSLIAKNNEVLNNIGSLILDLRGARVSRGESNISIKAFIGKIYFIVPYYMCINVEEIGCFGSNTKIINYGISREEANRLDYPIINLKFINCIGGKIVIEKTYSEKCNVESIKRDVDWYNYPLKKNQGNHNKKYKEKCNRGHHGNHGYYEHHGHHEHYGHHGNHGCSGYDYGYDYRYSYGNHDNNYDC